VVVGAGARLGLISPGEQEIPATAGIETLDDYRRRDGSQVAFIRLPIRLDTEVCDQYNVLMRDGAARQLACLISTRSEVQILFPLPVCD
jgi:hypothetical protein